ncbi:hypothetical protein G6F63_013473 [Rhizopus arrhizus]|nr:hypothetical protein G6F63_013473 [Rhizopus arrhizus]
MHGIHHPGQARDSCDGVPDACQRASLRGTQPGALRGTVDVHLPLQHRHQAIGPGQYVLDALGDFDRQLPDRFADQLIQVRGANAPTAQSDRRTVSPDTHQRHNPRGDREPDGPGRAYSCCVRQWIHALRGAHVPTKGGTHRRERRPRAASTKAGAPQVGA